MVIFGNDSDPVLIGQGLNENNDSLSSASVATEGLDVLLIGSAIK